MFSIYFRLPNSSLLRTLFISHFPLNNMVPARYKYETHGPCSLFVHQIKLYLYFRTFSMLKLFYNDKSFYWLVIIRFRQLLGLNALVRIAHCVAIQTLCRATPSMVTTNTTLSLNTILSIDRSISLFLKQRLCTFSHYLVLTLSCIGCHHVLSNYMSYWAFTNFIWWCHAQSHKFISLKIAYVRHFHRFYTESFAHCSI